MALVITAFAAGYAVLAARLQKAAAAVEAWRRARRDYLALRELDDAALRDIGLSRADLRAAAAAALFDDPTIIVAARALERRAGGRIARPDQAVTRAVAGTAPAGAARDLSCRAG